MPLYSSSAKVASTITSSTHVRTEQPLAGRPIVMPRCCPSHRDWATLAEHLLGYFTDVPASAVISELRLARDAVELFDLEMEDALDCAELIVRQRVISATGSMAPSSGAEPPAAFVQVA